MLISIMCYNAAPKDTEISITKSQVILLGVFQKVGHGWSLGSWDSKGDVLNRNASGWGLGGWQSTCLAQAKL